MKQLTFQEAFRFLSIAELEKVVPSAFTKKASDRATRDYIVIETPLVLQDLEQFGWRPVNATQVKPKLKSNEGYQKHFIRLRNEKMYIGTKSNICIIPELVLVNSYDARCSLSIYVGLHRVVCGNNHTCFPVKFIDPDLNKEVAHIPHRGYTMEEWSNLVKSIFRQIDRILTLIEQMQSIELTHKECKWLAEQVCRCRWDYTYKLHDASSILQPLRDEDTGNDLFTVFNLLQEKIIRGGWKGSGGRAIKPLTDPNREVLVNKKMFEVVEHFIEQKMKVLV